MKTIVHKALLISLSIIVLFLFSACENEGPAEKAGENIDEAIEETKEKLEDTGEAVEESVEETGEKVEETAENLKN